MMPRGWWRKMAPQIPAISRALLSVDQAAQQLGISTGTMRNWISVRRIAHVKVGRLTRIQQAAIDRYITDHTVDAVDGQ
jgi:excisionase family DNA binding protein